jgi:acetyltransferase (GNAT) family protein
MQQGFHPSEHFDISAMAAFMRQPDIFAATMDALSPAPENIDYESFLLGPNVRTIACLYNHGIIGYVQFQAKTSVAVELTVAFLPQARGKIAHTFCSYAIEQAWSRCLTVFALVPSDNLAARQGCRLLGFECEGRLRHAITRVETKHRPAGLYDILIYGLHNPRLRK